jgi:hypothetical protein
MSWPEAICSGKLPKKKLMSNEYFSRVARICVLQLRKYQPQFAGHKTKKYYQFTNSKRCPRLN